MLIELLRYSGNIFEIFKGRNSSMFVINIHNIAIEMVLLDKMINTENIPLRKELPH